MHEKLGRLLNDAIASCKAVYKEHHSDELNYDALFRLVFRLVAAKLLGDRQHPGNWLSTNAQEVIKEVENFYFQHSLPEHALKDEYVQNTAWDQIRKAFSFQNLSVEALAYVYENTFVSSEIRKKYGTHATRPQITEYIVQNLPFEELAQDERRVFEPFCGHAPFLIAALARLRALLPANVDVRQRHDYFVRMLAGMELDSFACEVARYCLILTDYPNPNGWRIENDNVFSSPNLENHLNQANIVLCNPPYEAFTRASRKSNPSIYSAHKAAEALRRVLQQPPKMLGFVLPRVFISGQSYRDVRKQVDALYNTTTLVELPDNAFNYSDAETVLLIAHEQRTTHTIPVRRSLRVEKKDYEGFLYTGKPTLETRNSILPIQNDLGTILWTNRLQKIWDVLTSLPRLESVVEIHNGIQYNVAFEEHKAELVSDIPRPGFVAGLARMTSRFEPYAISSFEYLSSDPKKRRRNAHKLPWDKPKVIVNAARKSRGSWTIVASIDEQGLVCYQNFHGIWPKSLSGNLSEAALMQDQNRVFG